MHIVSFDIVNCGGGFIPCVNIEMEIEGAQETIDDANRYGSRSEATREQLAHALGEEIISRIEAFYEHERSLNTVLRD